MSKFDVTKDHQKHRDAQGKVSYTQNGRTYTAGGRDTGSSSVDDPSTNPRKQDVRDRAAERLAGFRDDDAPSTIEEAMRENRAAAAADSSS